MIRREMKEDMPLAADRAALIEALRQTHPALARLTSGVSGARLDYRGAPEEWTVREILAHLVGDEMYVRLGARGLPAGVWDLYR